MAYVAVGPGVRVARRVARVRYNLYAITVRRLQALRSFAANRYAAAGIHADG
eukprot:SAG31_NODE_659_length_13095_cov_4.439597_6_plen_52_part_00